MEDYVAMLRWFYDPNNRDEAVGIVARFLKRPPAVFADWLFTKRDFYRALDGRPEVSVVQQSIDRVQEVGFIKQTIDVSKYVDLSLLDEAAKRRR
jgi:NitT/TauT family transport system substrate-binding protein